MKKIIALILAAICCLGTAALLTACNGNDKKGEDVGVFCFVADGTEIELGKDASKVIKKLGSAKEIKSNGNCGGLGEQIKYTYNGFNLYTLKSNSGEEIVDQIDFTNDIIETPKGVRIGTSESDLLKAYGNPSKKTDDDIIYTSGSKYLKFEMEKGVVAEITYGIDSDAD